MKILNRLLLLTIVFILLQPSLLAQNHIAQSVFANGGTVAGAETYRIQVSEDSGLSSVFLDSRLSQTTLKFPKPLEETMSYYWRVITLNENTESDWLTVWMFTTTMATSTGIAGDLPSSFELYQNYPNPFNPSTQIQFEISQEANVRLEIFNVLGQRVVVLVDERKAAGYYIEHFDAGHLTSGIYLYRIQAG